MGGLEEEEEEEQSSTLPLTLAELQSALSDDSSDDEDATVSCEVADGVLSEAASHSLLLDCNGLSAEQASEVEALTIFQQRRYRRVSGLQPFSALRQLEILHQSQPADHTQPARACSTARAGQRRVGTQQQQSEI